tara:strand:- start:1341 stop:1778 length:438 start_codon:yes stop_codon:yes gene_type:complete
MSKFILLNCTKSNNYIIMNQIEKPLSILLIVGVIIFSFMYNSNNGYSIKSTNTEMGYFINSANLDDGYNVTNAELKNPVFLKALFGLETKTIDEVAIEDSISTQQNMSELIEEVSEDKLEEVIEVVNEELIEEVEGSEIDDNTDK